MGGRQARRTYWAGIMEQWRLSGQSKAGFCRDQGLRECQFHYWYRKLLEKQTVSECGFARVDAGTLDSGLCFRFPGGLQLALSRDFDETTLKRFLSVASSSC